MELKEICSKISNHMLKGIMLHDELTSYYEFLALPGYSKCQCYHFTEEVLAYRKFVSYCIKHCNILIPKTEEVTPEQVIPDSWYNHTRQDVDSSTKKNAVHAGMEKWVEWERETKKLYEKLYTECMNDGNAMMSTILVDLVADVSEELSKAEQYELELEAVGYDLSIIIERQHDLHHKYEKEIRKLLC